MDLKNGIGFLKRIMEVQSIERPWPDRDSRLPE